MGLRFHVETDHEPLVPLLSTKRLHELTPRLQRMRVQVLEFDFSISHVPGKDVYTAVVLSRKLTDQSNGNIDSFINEYEMLTLDLLLASPALLDKIRTELRRDPTIARVM